MISEYDTDEANELAEMVAGEEGTRPKKSDSAKAAEKAKKAAAKEKERKEREEEAKNKKALVEERRRKREREEVAEKEAKKNKRPKVSTVTKKSEEPQKQKVKKVVEKTYDEDGNSDDDTIDLDRQDADDEEEAVLTVWDKLTPEMKEVLAESGFPRAKCNKMSHNEVTKA